MQNKELPAHLQERIEQGAQEWATNGSLKEWINTGMNDTRFSSKKKTFLAGASFLYSLLKEEMGEVAGVWRKATEVVDKIPEYKSVFARLPKDEIVSSGFFTRSGELFICDRDNHPIDSTRFNELEILDDSPIAAYTSDIDHWIQTGELTPELQQLMKEVYEERKPLK